MARLKPSQLSDRLYARGLTRSTVRDYMAAIATADEWCREQGWTLRTAPGSVMVRFFTTLPPSWATRKRYRAAITHYWKITRRPNAPYGALPLPRKPRGECRALSADDAARLFSVARDWDGPEGLAVLLGLCMALRRFEIAKVHRSDFKSGMLRIVGKGGSVASLPVPTTLVEPIKACLRSSPEGWLFPGRFGDGPVTPMTITNYVADVARAAGVQCTPHQLRHTALATLNDETGDLRATMEFARHRSPETTLIYTRTLKSKLEGMAESLTYGHEPGD